MSDKRRAEIEAKRLKLAELRKARADRQKNDLERRATEVRTLPISFPQNTLRSHFISCTPKASAGAPIAARRDVDSLINQLVGPEGGILSPSPRRLRTPDLTSPISSSPGTPSVGYGGYGAGPSGLGLGSGRVSRGSDFGSDGRVSLGTTLAHSGTDNVVDR